MSPRQAVHNFLHAADLPAAAWGRNRVASLPGLTVTVQAMVDALQAVAGTEVAARITWQPDAFIEKIVGSWPARFAPERALAMGFAADESMDEIIQAFIEEELS
jgi:hypothetical protein